MPVDTLRAFFFLHDSGRDGFQYGMCSLLHDGKSHNLPLPLLSSALGTLAVSGEETTMLSGIGALHELSDMGV